LGPIGGLSAGQFNNCLPRIEEDEDDDHVILAENGLCCCTMSVCLFITHQYYVKTAKLVYKLFSLLGIHIILVFFSTKLYGNIYDLFNGAIFSNVE